LETFQTDFTSGTATGEDFKNTAEQVTGMDFDYFFNQWYYGEGYPIYDIDWFSTDQVFYLTSTQSTSATTPFFDMLMEYRLLFNDGTDTIVKLRQSANVNTFEIATGKKVGLVVVDPEKWTMEKVNSVIIDMHEIESPVYFTVGPNPVTDQLNVYFPNSVNSDISLELTDLNGKRIYKANIHNEKTKIDMSELPRGMYILQATNGQNSMHRKLLK